MAQSSLESGRGRGLRLRQRLAACDKSIAAGKVDAAAYELRSRLKLLLGDCAGGWRDVLSSIAFDPPESANYSQGPEMPAVFPRPPRRDLARGLAPRTRTPVWFMIEALDRQISRRRPRAEAWAWRGALKRRLSDYAGAVADFERAEKLGLRSAMIRTWRGEAKIQILDFRGGREDLTGALKLPCEAWNYAWCGRAFLTYFRDPEGLAYLDKAIALAPRYGFYYAWRGLAKFQLGSRQGPLADFKIALARDRDRRYHPEILCWRGLAYLQKGLNRKALSDFDAAIESRPDFAVAMHARAQALRKLKRHGEWVVAFDQAARLRSKHVQAIYAESPKGLRALVADLTSALEKAPGLAAARRWRGLSLTRLGKLVEARADLDRAVRLDPRDPWSRIWHGELLARIGEARGALADFNRALQIAPDSTPALLGRARVLISLGRFQHALRDLDAAGLRDPHWASVFADRGALNILLRRPRKALRDLEYAAGRTGGYANVHADLVFTLGLLGNWAKARRHLRLARSLDRAGTDARLSVWTGHWENNGSSVPPRLLSLIRKPPSARTPTR